MQVTGNPSRSHRTALVFDISSIDQAKSDYNERVQKLVSSVNRPPSSGPQGTIKVDTFTFDGVTLRPGAPTEQVPVVQDDGPTLEEWAAEQGYTQLVVSSPVAG